MNKTKKILLLLVLFFGICQSAFSISPQTGWWWNADESGRGYTIEQQGDKIFFAAYLYSDDGSAVWYTADMNKTADDQFAGDLVQFQNGQTLTGSYQKPELAGMPGAISLKFSSETEATLTLLNTDIAITRFIFENNSTTVTKQETGWWWNATESGRGYAIEQQGDKIFFAAYLYSDTGNAVWHTALMKQTASGQFTGELEEFQNGQTLTSDYQKPELAGMPGTVSLEFSGETDGTLTVLNTAIPITRFRFGVVQATSSTTQVRFALSQNGQSLGDIIVDLDTEKAPITTTNFLTYVNDKFYDGTLFHRVIPDFVIQGGGLTPGLVEKQTRDPIKNEADNGLKNDRATIAMARTNNPDTARSQFFFNLKDNDFLNFTSATTSGFGYAVFGRISQGEEILDQIAATQTQSIGGRTDVPVVDIIIDKAEVVK